MCHVVIDHKVTPQVPLDQAGQLRATLDATKRRALPLAARHELEGARRDLLTGLGNANDRRNAPALVARLQRRAHDLDVARAVERVVQAAVGHLNQVGHDGVTALDGRHLGRVEKVGSAKLLRPRGLARVGVDSNDALRTTLLGTVDHRETNAANAPYGDRGVLLDLRRVHGSAIARRHTTAQQARAVHRRIGVDGDERVLRHDRVLAKRRRAHKVEELLARAHRREALRAIGHHATTLRRPHGLAQVRLARQAELALTALCRVEQDHIVALLHVRHTLTHRLNDARALVAQNRRERSLGIATRQRVRIGVAQARERHTHAHLSGAGRRHTHLLNLERLLRLPRNRRLASDRLALGRHGEVARLWPEDTSVSRDEARAPSTATAGGCSAA